MATRLQEIREKIGTSQREANTIDERVISSFLHVMKMRTALGDPFEEFYDNLCGDIALNIFNGYLPKDSLLTEEDMKYLYESEKKYGKRV